MFNPIQIGSACNKLSEFLVRISEVPNVNLDKICFSLPIDVGGDKVVLKEEPGFFAVEMPEFTHEFLSDKPNAKTVCAAVLAYQSVARRDENEDKAQELVCSMAKNGDVFVEDMDSNIIDLFLKMWSDAYGEDEPAMYVHASTNDRTGETVITGYIKTKLSPAEIAARANEDGAAEMTSAVGGSVKMKEAM